MRCRLQLLLYCVFYLYHATDMRLRRLSVTYSLLALNMCWSIWVECVRGARARSIHCFPSFFPHFCFCAYARAGIDIQLLHHHIMSILCLSYVQKRAGVCCGYKVVKVVFIHHASVHSETADRRLGCPCRFIGLSLCKDLSCILCTSYVYIE